MFTSRVLRCSRVILGAVGRNFNTPRVQSGLCYQNQIPSIPLARFLSDQTTIGRIKPTMSIIFTCNVCKTRQAKTMSKKSYEKGVVLIRCDGCDNLHLIADNLGWFRDEKINIVDILREKEEEVRTLSGVDLLDVTDLGLFEEAAGEKGN